MPIFGGKKKTPAAAPKQPPPMPKGSGKGATGRGAGAASSMPRVMATPVGDGRPRAPGGPPARSGPSPEALQGMLAEIREEMLTPLSQMLDEPPNEDMAPLVDYLLGEARAKMENLQEQTPHISDDDSILVVGLASEFQDIQTRAEAWKRRCGGGGGPSQPAAPEAAADHEDADLAEAMRQSAAAEERNVSFQQSDAMRQAQANAEHEEAMRQAQANEAAMLHLQLEADRQRQAEETHAAQMQEEAVRAGQAAAAAAAQAAQAGHDERSRQEALAEQHRQEDIQRQRQAQAEADSRHAHSEAARLAAEEEAHARRLQDQAIAADNAAAQAADAAAREKDESKRAADFAELHRQQEMAHQLHAQAEEERLHAEMLRLQQGSDSQAKTQARRAAAEAMLREAMHGAGRDDLELLEDAIDEAREVGLAGAFGGKLLGDAEKRLAMLYLEEATSAPEISAEDLQQALAMCSEAGVPESELLASRSILDGLGEQGLAEKELEDAMQSTDPARLQRVIHSAQNAGVSSELIHLAERNLMAIKMITQSGGDNRKVVVQAWRGLVVDMTAAKLKLEDTVKGPASANAIEAVVAQVQELGPKGVDGQVLQHALAVAGQRRQAHDQVVCALVSQDPQELEAAKGAVEAAGGPGNDFDRLYLAMQDIEEDERLLQELDSALPGAVAMYIQEKMAKPPTLKEVTGGAPGATGALATAGVATAGVAAASATLALAPIQPSAVSSTWAPLAPAVASAAPSSAVLPPPSSPPVPEAASEPSISELLSKLFGGGGTTKKPATQGGIAAVDGKKPPPVDAVATQKAMKLKVERARQWVHSQDKAHREAAVNPRSSQAAQNFNSTASQVGHYANSGLRR